MSDTPRRRPWQLLLTGESLEHIDEPTRQALDRILELIPDLPGMVVHTADGAVSVTRDFPSNYMREVDDLLDGIFKNNTAVTAIGFTDCDEPRTATPEDPYFSAFGKAYANIRQAAERGEITAEEAIAAYRRAVSASK